MTKLQETFETRKSSCMIARGVPPAAYSPVWVGTPVLAEVSPSLSPAGPGTGPVTGLGVRTPIGKELGPEAGVPPRKDLGLVHQRLGYPPCGRTDTCENITFSRTPAVTKGRGGGIEPGFYVGSVVYKRLYDLVVTGQCREVQRRVRVLILVVHHHTVLSHQLTHDTETRKQHHVRDTVHLQEPIFEMLIKYF